MKLDDFLEENFNKLGEVPFYDIMENVRKNLLANAYEKGHHKSEKSSKYLNVSRTNMTEMLQRYDLHIMSRKPRTKKSPVLISV